MRIYGLLSGFDDTVDEQPKDFSYKKAGSYAR
jgi:hypothetical protein